MCESRNQHIHVYLLLSLRVLSNTIGIHSNKCTHRSISTALVGEINKHTQISIYKHRQNSNLLHLFSYYTHSSMGTDALQRIPAGLSPHHCHRIQNLLRVRWRIQPQHTRLLPRSPLWWSVFTHCTGRNTSPPSPPPWTWREKCMSALATHTGNTNTLWNIIIIFFCRN